MATFANPDPKEGPFMSAIAWRLRVGIPVLVLAAACGQPTSNPDPGAAQMRSPAEDAAAVEAAIGQHWEAIAAGDRAAIESHHLPGITIFMATVDERFTAGSPTEQTLVDSLEPGSVVWAPRDFDIQVRGEAAVASFYLDGQVTSADGVVDSRTRRVSAVWVRQADGRWLELHHHDSITAPEATGGN